MWPLAGRNSRKEAILITLVAIVLTIITISGFVLSLCTFVLDLHDRWDKHKEK